MATSSLSATGEDLPKVEARVIYGDPSMHDAFLNVADAAAYSVVEDPHEIAISDARPILRDLSLDREGFTLVLHRSEVAGRDDFLTLNGTRQGDDPPLNRRYVAEVMPVIERLVPGATIIPQTRRIMIRATARAGRLTPDPIAALVHLDYSEGLARQVLEDSFAALGRSVPPHRRMAILQTWRNVAEPPQDNSLAICDASTVSFDDSIIMRTISSGGEDKQVRLCRYNPAHRWYYFSDIRPDELLVFKGYDTAFPRSMTGAHVAFALPAGDQGNPRVSVEARFIALYP